MTAYTFRCTLCGDTYAADEVKYVCPKHGDAGVLDTVIEKFANFPTKENLIRNWRLSMWRYYPLLPIERELNNDALTHLMNHTTPLSSVGWTPLHWAERLGKQLGVTNLYIKDDGRHASASFKDRASAFVVAKAIERGEKIITTASSGNAGAALACMCAAVGMPCVIFVPRSAPQAKVAQLLMYGATVMLVKGNYDDAFDLSLTASKEFGWYCRNTAYNPFTLEGKKTVSFEICEQLGWHAPDRIFVAVGDGNIISGVWKGLNDLRSLGWIDRLPKLVGVQAQGSAACYDAWRAGSDSIEPVDAHTIADSISVDRPRDGLRAVRSVRESGGEFVTVSDEDILQAMKTLAQEAAVFAEPAGAAGFAGLQKMLRQNQIDRDGTIVVIVTGSGLKDIPAAMKASGEAQVIEPTLDAVRRML